MLPQGIRFQTDDGLSLEGEIRVPTGAVRAPAVICHPHPRFGGSKDHPLLWGIRIELNRVGFVVLSFNFRGVMGSEGEYGGGAAEVADVRAALERVLEESRAPVFLVGWSFGAHVALREAVDDDRVRGLALVGIPLVDPDLPPLPETDRLAAFDRPVLLLSGAEDRFSPAHDVLALAGKIRDAAVEILPGADHYFGKREREAGAIVSEFAVRTILERETG
jgi:alpha/beta superfamily hydrolase